MKQTVQISRRQPMMSNVNRTRLQPAVEQGEAPVIARRTPVVSAVRRPEPMPVAKPRGIELSPAAQQQINNASAAINTKQASSTDDRPTIISVHNLVKTYKLGKRKIEVLKGINLDIRRGEFVAITGASGSGKSTLLQLLGGLDKPTGGEVICDGVNLAKLSDAKLSSFRGRTVGFVFQSFYLQPFLKLDKNVAVPAMFARMQRGARDTIVSNLLKAVGLDDVKSHYPKELSGGQIQRAAIARALVNHPKILLADEPTGNLDSRNSDEVINLFHRIRDRLGTTVVVVTHNPEIAAGADREIKLVDGTTQ